MNLIKQAIKIKEKGEYETCTMNNFIRKACSVYAQMIINSKAIGEVIKN